MKKTTVAVALIVVVLALGLVGAVTAPSSHTHSLNCRSQRTIVWEVVVVNKTDLSSTTSYTTVSTQFEAVSTYTTLANRSASAGAVFSTTSFLQQFTGPVSDYVGFTCTYEKG
jgi:hypothetical protein